MSIWEGHDGWEETEPVHTSLSRPIKHRMFHVKHYAIVYQGNFSNPLVPLITNWCGVIKVTVR